MESEGEKEISGEKEREKEVRVQKGGREGKRQKR